MYIWLVQVTDNATGERNAIKVPAVTNDDATRKLTNAGLFGYKGLYSWRGTEPAYSEDGERLTLEARS